MTVPGDTASCNILSMFSRRTRWNLETNAFTVALQDHQRQGRETFDLTASNPTQVGLNVDTQAVLRALSHAEVLDYDPQPRGLPGARKAVRDYYASLGAELTEEQLLLTTSTSEAYSFAFRLLCDPEDEVLIPTPSYPLFEFLAQIQDVNLVPYELVYDHGWQIDFHSMEKAITARTRAIILVNPNNPTGSFVTETERNSSTVSAGNTRWRSLWMKSSSTSTCRTRSSPTMAANRDVLTFTLSGLSKVAGLPQMKVAWIATTGPRELTAPALERLEVIADTYLSMNAPVQHAIPELLDLRQDFQQQLMTRLRANLAELDAQLRQQKLITRLQVTGGWYATLRVPVTRTDEELAIELLRETGVLVHPGHFFDFASDGYLIVSLMTPETMFAEGIGRVLRYIS